MTKRAFMFPGQGSQAVGMGKALAEKYPIAADVFSDADTLLGWSISRFAWEGPEEELKRTDRTQPALFVTSVAAFEVLKSLGVAPDLAAGHSVGEYAALYAAGVFDFETGLRLVDLRGRAMHEASLANPGGMSALLGIELDAAIECCKAVRDEGKGAVSVANINTPGQVVISGDLTALDLAVRLARMKGATKVVPLAVAGAWHCDLMKSAEEKLATAIAKADFNDPSIPVVANITAAAVANAAEIKSLLVNQVCGSVLWSLSIEELHELGAGSFVEVGHGNVLSGMMKRIVKNVEVLKAGTPEEIEAIAGKAGQGASHVIC